MNTNPMFDVTKMLPSKTFLHMDQAGVYDNKICWTTNNAYHI